MNGFFTLNLSKHFLRQHVSNLLDYGFRTVHKILYMIEKKFRSIFTKSGHLSKKKQKFFLTYNRVDSKYVVLENVWIELSKKCKKPIHIRKIQKSGFRALNS